MSTRMRKKRKRTKIGDILLLFLLQMSTGIFCRKADQTDWFLTFLSWTGTKNYPTWRDVVLRCSIVWEKKMLMVTTRLTWNMSKQLVSSRYFLFV
jgi:hypothetical protein